MCYDISQNYIWYLSELRLQDNRVYIIGLNAQNRNGFEESDEKDVS